MDNPISAVLQTLPQIAGNAAKPERGEPGPGDVGPSTQDKAGTGLITLEMTGEEVAKWWKRVERAKKRVTAREEKWDTLLKEYLPIVSKSGDAETVKVQAHFRNVHSKIGQLFYRSPDLVLTPREVSPAQNTMPNPMAQMLPQGAPKPPDLTLEDIISVKQSILTQKLGRDGIKINRLMDELLFDVLAWAGIGCAKLGYRCVMKPYNKPLMQPDPNFVAPPPAMGSMLGIGPTPQPQMVPVIDPLTGKPQTEVVQVPVFEDWYMRRFSPKKALWNDDLRSTRFDEDATWMGMDFFMSKEQAMKSLGLTEAEASKACQDDRLHVYEQDKQGGDTPQLVHGVELFCKASVFTDEVHPQAINQLILIEGLTTRPAVWRPSPDQTFDEQGKLTDDSLIGFPIRVLTIRDLADSPFPESDSAFTNSEIKQLSTWRRQSIKLRDAAIGKYFYDQGAFDPDEINILKDGEIGAYIGVAEGKLSQGADKIFTTSAQIHGTNDDYRGAEAIKRDIDETLGISANSAGASESTVRSATETQTVRDAMSARNDKELGRVVDFYLDAARMIDQLLMRYADTTEIIHIAGEAGARRLMAWNNQVISGKFLYDIAPDSQMRMDTAKDFQLTSNYYNLTAKDPLSNRAYVLSRMARMRGFDPSKAVIPQSQIPKPPPEKPKISLALKGEDLANPAVVIMLTRLGVFTQQEAQVSDPPEPEPTAGGQPAHGGSAAKADTVSAHHDSNSGGKPNAPGSSDHRAAQPK